MSNKTLYRFDEFCLDLNKKKLFYAENPVSLTPKAFQTLLVLLQNRHQVVSKDFLLNEVWANTFVEETTLSQNILTLRKTLAGFQKDREFIVTFPRQGFRFVADVDEISAQDEFVIVEKTTKTDIITEQQFEITSETEETDFSREVDKTNLSILHQKYLISGGIGLALVGLFCALVGGFLTWLLLSKSNEGKTQSVSFRTLASDSSIKNAIVSPNGKFLALIKDRESHQSLSLQQIENGNIIEIVPKINGNLQGFTFSPDSEQIFFTVQENNIGTLYKISILGGASRMILKNIDSPAAVSPDKTLIAFLRKNPENQTTLLMTTDIDGKNEQSLAEDSDDEKFSHNSLTWSPDGKNLLLAVNRISKDRQYSELAVINAKSGEINILTNQKWNRVAQVAWLKNSQGIVLSSFRENSPTVSDELWFISYPDGNAKYLTNGLKSNLSLSLNDSSNSIVALKTEKLTCFLSASLDNFRKSNHIATRIGDSCQFPIGADWTNDGKIIYSTTEGGNADLWTINEDGGGKKQLTADESAEISPQISRDGNFLIFLSNRSGKMSVWRSNINGTNPTQLTYDVNVKETIFSPVSEEIFYLVQNPDGKTETLWKISMNGENNKQIIFKNTRSPRLSPDGKTIAAYYQNDDNKMVLSFLSAETGELLRTFETPTHDDIPFLDWGKNGEQLYLILREGKVYSIWKFAVKDNKFEKIREWENDAIFRFVVSKDGERVFYEVGTEIIKVIQIDTF